ncbi:hypothetical protein ASF84_25995 [Pseudomonas sp. Leaf127]|uniref:hypothetical protein n=1 Tax=Pseudomonas sp. Leaf127 TaxID=1736267 RepID=UPI000703389C|nr:hypothetical protein [Pseudomonas sp. Leaf127]KQQ64395.1 hypothetical protein ASF84_25995 [Pseudomonas sp. Leaf127]
MTLLPVSGLSVLLLMGAQAAWAFDPELHRAYTRQAVAAWAGCASLLPEVGAALAAGTDAEDTGVLTAWQRLTHWHFYNRDGKLLPFWFIDRNIDRIFALRVEALEQLLQQKRPPITEVYEQAGRVLHYIQDMSVPAHVVPVFHVAGSADPFDSFKRRESLPAFSLSLDECQQLKAETATAPAYLHTLLNEAAESTLRAIGQRPSGPEMAENAWQRYWAWPARDPDEAAKGWGEYGTCTFALGPVNPGCKSEAELQAFFEQQYRQTLWNSVRVLAYLSRRVEP